MIAAHATIASREVDICLIPEVPFELDGPHGVLQYLEHVLASQGHAGELVVLLLLLLLMMMLLLLLLMMMMMMMTTMTMMTIMRMMTTI